MEPVWNDMDDLIGKVLAGEGSMQEEDTVRQWARQSDANRKYYEQVKLIFERAANTPADIEFDTEAAWNKVRQKMGLGKVIPLRNNKPAAFNQMLRIAASVVILIGVSYWIYQVTAPPVQTLAVVSDQVTLQDTLPDGSTAYLNKKKRIEIRIQPARQNPQGGVEGRGLFYGEA